MSRRPDDLVDPGVDGSAVLAERRAAEAAGARTQPGERAVERRSLFEDGAGVAF